MITKFPCLPQKDRTNQHDTPNKYHRELVHIRKRAVPRANGSYNNQRGEQAAGITMPACAITMMHFSHHACDCSFPRPPACTKVLLLPKQRQLSKQAVFRRPNTIQFQDSRLYPLPELHYVQASSEFVPRLTVTAPLRGFIATSMLPSEPCCILSHSLPVREIEKH